MRPTSRRRPPPSPTTCAPRWTPTRPRPQFFDSLNAHNRYAILHRIHDAKRPETRARRIAKYVAMCAAGEKIYP